MFTRLIIEINSILFNFCHLNEGIECMKAHKEVTQKGTQGG